MRFIILIVCLLLICQSAFAVALDPMKIGLGARTLGMGRTAVAIDQDLNSIFVNPANAAYLDRPGMTSMYTNLSEDMAYTLFGGAYPFDFGTLGMAYLSSGAAGFLESTVEAGRVVGTGNSFDYSSGVLCLVYGKKVEENLSLGASLKLFNKGFSGVSGGTGSGYDMDLGLLWKPKDNLTVGISQQNTLPSSIANIKWGTDTVEGIPFNTKIGVSYLPRKDILLASDMDYAANRPLALHAGLQWVPLNWLALRLGLDQLPSSSSDTTTNYSTGVGLNFKGFSFDYAYYYDTVLSSVNSAHYFSLAYLFPEVPKKKEEKPEEVAPKVEKKGLELKTFVDVPKEYWAYEPIGTLGALGVIGGYPDGTFRPGKSITRAEFTVMLIKAKKEKVGRIKQRMFLDLPANHWASPYVKAAVGKGWVKGYKDGTFKPNKEITRAEGVSVLARFDDLDIKEVYKLPFLDLKAGHWGTPAVSAARRAGLLNYIKGKEFKPNQPLTRAEVAYMLYQTSFIKNLL